MTEAHIVFGIPSYSASFCPEFFQSYVTTLSVLDRAWIGYSTCLLPSEGFITRARNAIVTDFLVKRPSGTHLFFLDDDIGWPAEKVVEFIHYDAGIVAGVYPEKKDGGTFPVAPVNQGEDFIEDTGLFKAALAPAGFMCIKREALAMMIQHCALYMSPTGEPQFNLFDSGIFMPDTGERAGPGDRGEFWSEDYYFIRQFQKLGGDVWIDPDIDFSHRGQKTWRANLNTAIQAAKQQRADSTPNPTE